MNSGKKKLKSRVELRISAKEREFWPNNTNFGKKYEFLVEKHEFRVRKREIWYKHTRILEKNTNFG